MSYKDFVKTILDYMGIAGIRGHSYFSIDDNGRYSAIVSDLRFYESSMSRSIYVRWGSGHQARIRVYDIVKL